jgi:acyl carrier protein
MATSDSVKSAVCETISDVLSLSAEDLGDETVLAANGWDSLVSLEALAQFEAQFRISLDLRLFHSARTIGQMIQLVEKAVADRP